MSEPKFDQELNTKTLQSIKEFHDLTDYFEMKDEEGNLVNSLEYLQKQETSINEFISNITTAENKDKLTKYSDNLSRINELNLKRDELVKFQKS